MDDPATNDLRRELRELGYLSHGLERWFSHDPWSSRTFWSELLALAAKVGTVTAVTCAALTTTLLAIQNPLSGGQLLSASVLYLLFFFALSTLSFVTLGLMLRVRYQTFVETPRMLVIIGLLAAGALALLLAAWTLGFPAGGSPYAMIAPILLIAAQFIATAVVVPAALLSLSIHETHQIPRIHRQSRIVPILLAGLGLLGCVVGWGLIDDQAVVTGPSQVVVRPTDARVALIAIDGIQIEDLDLLATSDSLEISSVDLPPGDSAPSIWASVGTGVDPSIHGVRSVEGISLAGGRKVAQRVSRLDFILRHIAPALGLASRKPLPPSERNRHHIWEILAERGVPSATINWWTTDEGSTGGLLSVSQTTIHRAAQSEDAQTRAIEIDRESVARAMTIANEDRRFLSLYLPGLDIVLNRLPADRSAGARAIVSTTELLDQLLETLRSNRFEIIIIGLPGETGSQAGFIARSPGAPRAGSAMQIAPAILDAYGFPASREMIEGPAAREMIDSYGTRQSAGDTREIDSDYYESLRSLGYL